MCDGDRSSLPHSGELGALAAKETVLKTRSPRNEEAPPGKTTSWLLGQRQSSEEGLFLAAEAGQDLYGLAVWLHNSPIVPSDLGLAPERPLSVSVLQAWTLSTGHLGHREPRAGLETHWLCSLGARGKLTPGVGTPGSRARLRGLKQQGAPGLPGREARALLGCRALVSPARSPGPAARLGVETVRRAPEEDTDPFLGDIFASSHTLGPSGAQPSRTEKVCV